MRLPVPIVCLLLDLRMHTRLFHCLNLFVHEGEPIAHNEATHLNLTFRNKRYDKREREKWQMTDGRDSSVHGWS